MSPAREPNPFAFRPPHLHPLVVAEVVRGAGLRVVRNDARRKPRRPAAFLAAHPAPYLVQRHLGAVLIDNRDWPHHTRSPAPHALALDVLAIE